jgi:multicomponent Na+:H+ antiporter subunit G
VSAALALLLAAVGALFVLVAGLGLLRMPDLFTRMHGASKAATLGNLLVVLAAALWFGDGWTVARALMIALFLLVTAPIAAHVLARAGAAAGCRLAPETTVDERPTGGKTPAPADGLADRASRLE